MVKGWSEIEGWSLEISGKKKLPLVIVNPALAWRVSIKILSAKDGWKQQFIAFTQKLTKELFELSETGK